MGKPPRQAVILAGGLGTRLGALTRETPKPLLPVAGKPFLDYLLWNLKRHGFERVLFLLGYKAMRIIEHYGSGAGHGLADDAQRNTRLETKSCTREDVPGLLDFLAENFPGRWLYDTQERLKVEPTPADILVLKGQGRIWGFCHLYHAGSRRIGPGIYWRKALGPGYGGLGPIGVSRDLRGRGLGFALLCYGVQRLKELGVQRMVIDWTTLADFYGKIGFKPWRSYLAYSRKL